MPLFRSDLTLKFLRTVGFEPSVGVEILVLPYDKPLKWLMIAREALVAKVATKVDSAQISDVE